MPFVFPGEKRAPQYKDGMGQSSHPCAHTTTTGPHQLEHPLRRPTPSSISLQLSLGCRKCSALCAAMSGQPSTPRKARTRCACHTSESAPRGVALRLALHAAHFLLGLLLVLLLRRFFLLKAPLKEEPWLWRDVSPLHLALLYKSRMALRGGTYLFKFVGFTVLRSKHGARRAYLCLSTGDHRRGINCAWLTP